MVNYYLLVIFISLVRYFLIQFQELKFNPSYLIKSENYNEMELVVIYIPFYKYF